MKQSLVCYIACLSHLNLIVNSGLDETSDIGNKLREEMGQYNDRLSDDDISLISHLLEEMHRISEKYKIKEIFTT